MIIPETTLCVIVRDELMNPAGGIRRFVEAHAPHFSRVDVADTGSVDGTREELNKLAQEFPQLTVYDHVFNGYAQSRNFLLEQVNTRRVQILDADELLLKEDVITLISFIEQNNVWGYNFPLINVLKDEEEGCCHNPRLFEVSRNAQYHGKTEWLYVEENEIRRRADRNKIETTKSPVPIYHFLPADTLAILLKQEHWYLDAAELRWKPPSQVQGFEHWKAYNPKREEYV